MMHFRRKTSFCFHNGSLIAAASISFYTFLFALPVYSETIILRSGKTVHGKVMDRTDKSVQLDVGLDFPVTYDMDEVDHIDPNQGAAEESPSIVTADPKTSKDADQLELQGLDLIDGGQMDQGVELLRKAIGIDPKANRHLNLGAILSGNGIMIFKEGRKDEAIHIFKEAEAEIKKAIDLFDPKEESTFLSQAYYLLGEMSARAFEEPQQARTYYQKSISFYPNPAAERGLNALSQQ